jgi:hypothetical protein
MADTPQTTDRSHSSLEYFAAIKIGVLDSKDRADLFLDMAQELLRLGFLLDSLRAPDSVRPHIAAAARICEQEAIREMSRIDRGVSLMRSLPGMTDTIDVEIADV